MSHLWLGVLRKVQHRSAEQKSELLAAIRLDPLNEQVALVASTSFWRAGDFDAATDIARLGLQHNPNYGALYSNLARAEMFRGHFAEAQRALDRAAGATEKASGLPENRALLLVLRGQKNEALAELHRIEREGSPDPSGMIQTYGAAGDVDDAMRWLERLARERPNFARVSMEVPAIPVYAALRNDPRYLRLWHRLGLPD